MANIYDIDGRIYLQCSTCGDYKELNEINFRKNSNKRGFFGFRSQCRECERARCRKYATDNSEYLSQYKKEYEREHKEWRKNYNRRYTLEHSEEIRIRKKKRNEDNRDRNYEIRKEYMKRYIRNRRNYKYPVSSAMRKLHRVTEDFINTNIIKPKKCSICNKERRIIAHHPNNDIRNEIVFCCDRCHRLIHSGYLECPKPIDLLRR